MVIHLTPLAAAFFWGMVAGSIVTLVGMRFLFKFVEGD